MRKRHVPQRSCVVCRTTMAKRSLIRVVRTPEGMIVVDPRGKVSGRGAYLCPRPECFSSGRARGAIAHALAVALGESEWSALQGELTRVAGDRIQELEVRSQSLP